MYVCIHVILGRLRQRQRTAIATTSAVTAFKFSYLSALKLLLPFCNCWLLLLSGAGAWRLYSHVVAVFGFSVWFLGTGVASLSFLVYSKGKPVFQRGPTGHGPLHWAWGETALCEYDYLLVLVCIRYTLWLLRMLSHESCFASKRKFCPFTNIPSLSLTAKYFFIWPQAACNKLFAFFFSCQFLVSF